MTSADEPLRYPDATSTLADGRMLSLYSLPGHHHQLVTDRRPLPSRDGLASELRYDRQTGDWIAIAAFRQDRTYKPPADQCPLCPSNTGELSEVPAADYDIAVFENRFPSLSGAGKSSTFSLPNIDDDMFPRGDGHGRCEVICFSSDHHASFASLDPGHARLVVDVWRHRTAEMLAMPGIAQVFCFENRGEEIGVTLSHPHGQIYGYSYLTPRTRAMLRQAEQHRNTHGSNLFDDLVADELADGSRVIAQTTEMVAFVPFAARWPVEVHIHPRRRVSNLIELTDVELTQLSSLYLDILGRLDRLYPSPLPYIAAVHQFSDNQPEGGMHIEVMSVRRSATKLKYLAGSESAMDAFVTDVTPEDVAQRLRKAGAPA